jgi:NAD(P)-dependent dehydrogenase (short-subunit alcohol dehydrogenase family)
VNAICPTYVRTKMTEQRLSDQEYLSNILNRTPLARVAEPSDLTGAVVFLASAASGMVTGHTLAVDGGWTVV